MVSVNERRASAFVSFNDILKQSSQSLNVPLMFDVPQETRRGLLPAMSSLTSSQSSLVFASPELKVAASTFLTTSFSFLGHSLFGSSPQRKASCGDSCKKSSVSVNALVDSGADIHILSCDDAKKMFTNVGPSSLKVVGVNGSTSQAVSQGSLVVHVQAPTGACHRIDLGTAHSMKSCPANLLSLSRLVDVGAVLHFEHGDCWFQPPPRFTDQGGSSVVSERIPLNRVGGLYEITLHNMALDFDTEPCSSFKAQVDTKFARENWDPVDFNDPQFHSFAVHGKSYLSGSLDLWHRRMSHLSKERLKQVHTHGLVDGFNLVGNSEVRCQCDTCAMAKIRAQASKRNRKFPNAPKRIGEHVSSDVKSVPFESFEGYKYVVNFVDHYSRLGICYFMRCKSEVTKCFERYCKELAHYGYRVMHLHSDRGSEYFSQEGELMADKDRSLGQLDVFCASQSPVIRHTVTPVGSKEKIAEIWFRDMFEAADALLFEARLSPAFWCDAVSYAQHCYNRIPNLHTGPSTPHQMLTGVRARWDKLRLFGCDAYHLIPNDPVAKVPGIVKGKKTIFVGFTEGCNGYRVFDPETRRYATVDNVYFYESFKHRIDALRHHDQRRALIRSGKPQPVQVDDWEDSNAEGVRNLFTSPDGAQRKEESPEEAESGSEESHIVRPLDEDLAMEVLRSAEVLRPLRLLPVGKEARWTKQDADFLAHARERNLPVSYVENPKSKGSASRLRYHRYSRATTLREALELGATTKDIQHDYRRGFIKFPSHESDLPGHVYNAVEVAADHGIHHILDDVARLVTPTVRTDYLLARAFVSPALERARYVFNDVLKSAYDPDLLPRELETVDAAARFAERQFAKVMNAQRGVNIDFSLAAEPTRWEETLPEVCSESEKWKEAMDDEIVSMTKFGVYKALPRSAAGNRQILGARWVYKRKVNKFGEVYRYRARLVAQGFRQKAYDSYDPDRTFSPVIHKDSLRMFLSVCAAENLRVYQADVKAAFLQAPLDEKIFVKAPPGYDSVDPMTGEPVVWELSKSIYGLKQSSACFWTAMDEHLRGNGFKSILGDPCLFRKVMSNGRVILAVTYVDDVTFAVSEDDDHAYFMSMLRSRFEVDYGEGKPIEFLLGMSIEQNLEAGTIRMSMEAPIVKLAHGILTPEEIAKCADVDIPMLPNAVLPRLKEREVPVATFDYLSVVGSLIHFANCMRPDISFAVGALARHGLCPGKAHVRAAKRTVMYLFNTRKLGITYRRPRSIDVERKNIPIIHEGAKHPLDNGLNLLQTFADSDYAGDETKRSTYGTTVMMNGGPIAWSSTLGKTIATSTCEAEIHAAVIAVKDAIHIKQMLIDLELYPKNRPLEIAEDNSAAIAQANSGIKYIRNAKHYEIRLRFLQQKVVDKEVEFRYCPTDHQIADLFTKPLDKQKFQWFRSSLLS